MILIRGGDFRMGSSGTTARHDEGPQFDVEVEPFYMGEHEVTWAEFGAFANAYQRLRKSRPHEISNEQYAASVIYPEEPFWSDETQPLLDRMGGKGAGMPAVTMSQFTARQYTKWLSAKTGRLYRLPSEAEWEYACRAGTQSPYYFGGDASLLDRYAWFFDSSSELDGEGGYHHVDLKQPNQWGLYDMHGNVAEWCIDQYSSDGYSQFAGRRVNWHDTIHWPTVRYPCAIRGGSFQSEASECRSASRLASGDRMNRGDWRNPKGIYFERDAFWVGMRLVSPLKEPNEEENHKVRATLRRNSEIVAAGQVPWRWRDRCAASSRPYVRTIPVRA